MKKIMTFCGMAALLVGLTGCVTHDLVGGELMSLSDVQFRNTRFRHGRSCTNLLFPVRVPFADGWMGIPLGGQARTLTAIQEGRINKVEFMEKTTEYYVLVGRVCTDVYGE